MGSGEGRGGFEKEKKTKPRSEDCHFILLNLAEAKEHPGPGAVSGGDRGGKEKDSCPC